jgi:hypothetical protein
MIIAVVKEKRVIFKASIKDYTDAKKAGMPTLMKSTMSKAQLACKELTKAINDVSTVA